MQPLDFVLMKTLLIGQVALQAGVGIGAVRLYERRGLIPAPRRTVSGYRQYPEDTVLRVRVIHAAKTLGFTLREMADLFSQLGPSGMSAATRNAVLDDKLRDVEARIRSLEHMRTLLQRLKRAAGHPGTRTECVLAEAALNIVQELDERHLARPAGRLVRGRTTG